MTSEVIVDVPKHRAPLHGQWPEHTRPELQLVRTVDLDARVVDDRPVWTHPSYVNEIRGGLSGKLHHLLTRNPARVSERERYTVLGEQGKHSFVDPSTLAELDGKLHVARKCR